MMARRLAFVIAGVFSAFVLMPGPAGAVCRPHCLDPNKNKGGDVRGLNRANDVAGEHGQHGRENAAAKQDLHKKGGSGVEVPPVPPPVTPPPVEPPPSDPCIGC